MKVIIVEDEQLAAERLVDLLRKHDPTIEVLATLESIKETLTWLERHQEPDLAFFDIQLADGVSLSIFKKLELSFPIIFTTAYNQYAIDAFNTNGIAYLLKPISLNDLKQAFSKYDLLKEVLGANSTSHFQTVMEMLKQQQKQQKDSFKKRFIVKSGIQILAVPVNSVLYFFTENKMTWIRHQNGNKYHLDIPLDQLLEQLNPNQFFRVNRQIIVAFDAIESIKVYGGSRLKLELAFQDQQEIVVSRERVSAFKAWLDQ